MPLLKHPSGDTYQPIFTDPIEFGKFNREKKFKAAIVEATKIPDVLVKEAKGVVVNPTGVNLQLPIKKRAQQNGQSPAGAQNPAGAQTPAGGQNPAGGQSPADAQGSEGVKNPQ